MKRQWKCFAPNCGHVNQDDDDLLTDEPICKACGLEHDWSEVLPVDNKAGALFVEKPIIYEDDGEILFATKR